MTYHLARNGQQTGTCTRDEAIARYARGEILPTDLVWCEGMANWAPASTVLGQTPAIPAPASQPSASTFGPMGAPAGSALPPPPKPENYLVGGILTTLFCCMPLGIAAIVFASQVDGKYARGDYVGAQESAKNAKLCTWIAVGVGVAGMVAYAGVMMFGALQGLH